MTRNLIVYGSGGLCNRLRPMASAIELAKQSNRRLLVFWNKEPHCSVPFQDLFDASQFNIIDRKELIAMGYAHKWSPLMPELKRIQSALSYQYSWSNEKKSLNGPKENIMFLSNNFAAGADKQVMQNLRDFRPIATIQDEICRLASLFDLNKKVIGIHARGTDMAGATYEYYANKVRKYAETHRLFLCTESEEFHKNFTKDFPNIMTAPNTIYVNKQDADSPWRQNLNIKEEAMAGSVIDLYLLARTNIQVSWPASSFAKVARIIGESYK